MGVSDLKLRMADVPGIHSLTMELQGGRIMLRWGNGYEAAVPAAASDHEIETAVRNAIQLAPVSSIPDKPAPVTTVLPPSQLQPQEGKSVSTNPASVGQTVKSLMEDHVKAMGEIHAAQLAILQSTLATQRNSVATAVGSVAAKIAAQTDEFQQIMGEFTNALGGEGL